MNLLADAYAYTRDYKGEPLTKWVQEHTEVPVVAVCIYLVVIFEVPNHIDKPLRLRPFNVAWNFALSAFSFIGASYTVSCLYRTLRDHNFTYTICEG